MQTRQWIPLTDKFEGWTIIDFLMTGVDGMIETRAVLIAPNGAIVTRSLYGAFNQEALFKVLPAADLSPIG